MYALAELSCSCESVCRYALVAKPLAPHTIPVFRAILYTFSQKCLKLSPQNSQTRKLSSYIVLLGQEMHPNIKFGLIGLKLAEISSFEHQYFSIPKNALQADSVQVSQIRAPNVENHAK